VQLGADALVTRSLWGCTCGGDRSFGGDDWVLAGEEKFGARDALSDRASVTDAPIPEYPLSYSLVQAAERFPDKAALIFGDVVQPLGNALFDTRVLYQDLLDQTYRFAAALQQAGVKKGDRVALHLPNCPQFVVAYYAALMIGAIAVPCNPAYVARELEHQLADSLSETIVTSDTSFALVQRVRAETAIVRVYVAKIAGCYPPLVRLFRLLSRRRQTREQNKLGDAGARWFRDAIGTASPRPLKVEVSMDDTAVLMYTGGTTGIPKAAELSHRNIQANAAQMASWLGCFDRNDDVVLTSLPLFHSYGMTTCMNMGILVGATLVLIRDARVLVHILKSIKRHRPTLYPGAPALYISLVNHPQVTKYDFRSIRACISGGAPLPVEVQERFQEMTGGCLVEGYGLSEASPVTHANPVLGENRVGSVGLPLSGTDARIMDLETGTRFLAAGEKGELVVRGPQVMKGYWRKPDATAAVLRHGWLHTGDIASIDQDGYCRIVDRKKDVIVGAGGFKVYPREVEEVLYGYPKVKSCAVVGVPVENKGERVKAYIVLQDNVAACPEEIQAFCRENLAPYKVPKFVEFREALPTVSTGKVLRRVLREESNPNRLSE